MLSDQKEQKVSYVCPECGGRAVHGMNCRELLEAIIVWEYQDPELLGEHFKTVASYNLQHPSQFTDEALRELRSIFIEHMDHDISIREIRKKMGLIFNGKKRVLKDESSRVISPHKWHMTIADVYLPDMPQGAAQRVRNWAAVVRTELNNLDDQK